MLIKQKHKSCFEILRIVMQNFIVLVEVIYKVSDKHKVVGFKRWEISNLIFCLTFSVFDFFSLCLSNLIFFLDYNSLNILIFFFRFFLLNLNNLSDLSPALELEYRLARDQISLMVFKLFQNLRWGRLSLLVLTRKQFLLVL